MSMFKTVAVEPDTVWLLRVQFSRSYRFWLMYSETHVLRGKINETKSSLIQLWTDTHGPFCKIIRYRGTCCPAEAAAAMAQDMIHIGDST